MGDSTRKATRRQREQFLMALSEVTQDNPEVMCRLNELAEHADLTPDQARYAFIWLLENVFAKGNWLHEGDNANINITVKGADEAERLRMSFWERIVSDKVMQKNIATGIVSGAIGGLIVLMISRLIQ